MSWLPLRRSDRSVERRGVGAPRRAVSTPGIIVIIVAAALAGVPGVGRAQNFEKAVLDQAKEATVYIKIRVNGRMAGSGSGFVIKSLPGGSVLVMTNRHVAHPDLGELPQGAKVTLGCVFRSGAPGEQEVPAELIAYDERRVPDLAVIEAKGVSNPPSPISPDTCVPESELSETMSACALGFPGGGGMVGDINRNPPISVNILSVNALIRNPKSHSLERIQFAGSMIQGNSGGPVVNVKGKLVGVVVERLGGENVGRAIPPNVIQRFLDGDIGGIKTAQLMGSIGPGTQVKLAVRLVDPLRRIKDISVRWAYQSNTPKQPGPAEGAHYQPIPGGTDVPLMIANGLATATFSLPINKPADRNVYFQFVGHNVTGPDRVSHALPVALPDRLGPIQSLNQDEDEEEKKLAKFSFDANAFEGAKITHNPGTTTFDLPANVPFSNMPQYNLFTSPCSMVKVDGDFTAVVKIQDTFSPGGEGIELPDGRKLGFSFQSAGLLLWENERNFIRLERAKQSDGKLSMTSRLLLEYYRDGKELATLYLDIPESEICAVVMERKGGGIKMLYAFPPKSTIVFKELALNMGPQVYIGVAAANLSKQRLKAKLDDFTVVGGDGMPIEPAPVKMNRLFDPGYVRKSDGTQVFEGATFKVAGTKSIPGLGPVAMDAFGSDWSDGRQLQWNNEKINQRASLALPVLKSGKYDVMVKLTMAPDYGNALFAIDERPLFNNKSINLYSATTKATKLFSLGVMAIQKGDHKLNVTITGKDAKSTGYHFGLDEFQLVPTEK